MKRIYPLFAFLFTIIVFIACRKDNGIKPGPGKDLKLSAAELQEASADNTFSFDLFRSVAANNGTGNLFISPLSVSMALGMTTNGANGATLDSMRNVLHMKGFSQDQVNTYYSDLLTQLPELDPNTTLKIANSVWYRNDFTVLPQFLQTENKSFQAKVEALDFNSPSSVNTINDWVSQQTGGKINKMISSIKAQDLMYLINAIYFKSAWATKFDPAQTANMPFTRSDNSQVQAAFMRNTTNFNMHRDDDVTLVELPYSNSKYSMVFVLPNTGKSVSDVAKLIDSAKWHEWMSRLSGSAVQLAMPKFAFSYSNEFKSNLSAMGMGLAFSDGADFSNISPGGHLCISSVAHKAYVAVDEAGTTAAAVTKVTITPTAILDNPVTLNRPFIFMIREMNSGLVLFTGIINDPTQSGE